ncbi:MAG TPA: DUF6345 domain-containing protein [Candidatus Obscuribacterales bacterium]
MTKRFALSRSLLTSALTLNLSLLALSGCNGNQPLPLFTGADSVAGKPAAHAKFEGNTSFENTDANDQTSSQSGVDGTATGLGNENGGSDSKFEQRVPVFQVVGEGLSSGQVQKLADAFGMQDLHLEADGSVSFIDAERFQHIPVRNSSSLGIRTMATGQASSGYAYATLKPAYYDAQLIKPIAVPTTEPTDNPYDPPQDINEDGEETVSEFLDMSALKQIKVMPEEVALDHILIGLNKAGLMPQGKPIVGHSEFEARAVSGGLTVKAQLDTQVGFEQRLGQLKLVGPGAKVKFALDGDGAVTQLRYATRQLSAGAMVSIIGPELAEQQALALLNEENPQANGHWEVSSELIYYAPPLSQHVKNILPHYQIQAKMRAGDGELISRMILLPAVKNGMKLNLDLKQDGTEMQAAARVEGGTAPYSYSWGSATSQIDTAFGNKPEIAYKFRPRERSDKETLYLTVTDANGLSSSARVSRPILSPELISSYDSNHFTTAMPGRFDAGVEWIGLSMGLPGSHDNAYGFVNGFNGRGVPIEFNWGNYAAWEEDFKKTSMGGTDDYYVDNVDMVFYTGHANGNGWSFPGTRDDDFLRFNEGSYGEKELEWLMIAACGPMQMYEGGVHLFDRWGGAFKGLHMLAGYATVSYDTTIEGDRLARHLLAENMTVRSAWAQMATEAQPSSVTYGYMGVIGPAGQSNWNDHYWGHGEVGPDIHDVRGYWAVHAPS